MTHILAIDPGPRESAFVRLCGNDGMTMGKVSNDSMRVVLLERGPCMVAIEMIASYGMSVGAEVFETCLHIGQFLHIAPDAICVYRKDEKMFLCGSMKAKDSSIRQAIIDRYRQPDGKCPTKKGGPLHGVSGDVWSALAIALTVRDARGTVRTFKEQGIL